MAKARKKTPDVSTEERIKAAARTLFTKKGFAATRTRDISREAGINLALLNYYYGSKENLFALVMTEILQNFFRSILEIFNDESTSLQQKIEVFVSRYTGFLKQQPEIPLFIFHELRRDPQALATKMGAKVVLKSYFFRQLSEQVNKKKTARVNPLQHFISMIALSVFPFIAAPLLQHIAGLDARAFEAVIDEREKMIPVWMKSLMKT